MASDNSAVRGAGMDRRTFLRLTGVAGASALGVGCSDRKDSLKYLYANLVPEEDVPLGDDTWFASLCGECRAGCSVLVRIVAGRAKKIEGNPLFPVNRGKTCARGQATLQALYNPDRWREPQRRRADGRLTPVSWEAALNEAADSLTRVREKGQRLLVVTPPLTGHLHLLFHRFTERFSATTEWVRWSAFEDTVMRRAVYDNLRLERLPVYRIEDADLVLSFGADLLGAELSPVHYANQYGRFRQGNPLNPVDSHGARGVWYQFEPRLSLTASNADRWIPVEPGYEGLIALAVARLLWENGKIRLSTSEQEAWNELLMGVSIVEAQRHLDARSMLLEEVADRLSRAERPLVIGGGTAAAPVNGSANMWAIQTLQWLVAHGRPWPFMFTNPPSPLKTITPFREAGDGSELTNGESGFRRLQKIGQTILDSDGQPYGAMLIYGADLVHALPRAAPFRRAFERIPLVIDVSPFPDDTAMRATLVLPARTLLESWGDGVPEPGPGVPAWGLAQPTVALAGDARAPGDVILELAKRLGGALADALPWKDTAQAIDDSVFQMYEQFSTEIGQTSYEAFFNQLVAQGGWYQRLDGDEFVPLNDHRKPPGKSFPLSELPEMVPRFEGTVDQYPFYLVPYPSTLLLYGQGANRPWLQELGDPLTTVVWGTWAEIHPKTAVSLGLREGDEVTLQTPFGAIEVPIYPYPGVRPDTIAVPAGGGYQAYGQFAKGVGANVMTLLPPMEEERTGALAWISTRVKVSPTGRKGKLVKLEGNGQWLEGVDFPA